MGRGGGHVVSMLDFYSDDLSSNRAKVYNLSAKIVAEQDESKQKEAEVGPFKETSKSADTLNLTNLLNSNQSNRRSVVLTVILPFIK